MKIKLTFILLFSLLLFQVKAQSAEEISESFLEIKALSTLDTSLSMENAIIIRDEFLKKVSKKVGKKVGYKAGFTNPASQKNFGVTGPSSGILFKNMLLKNGSEIKVNAGLRLMFEGDLLLRVSSHKINQATTIQEVLANLDAVIPFIELPDLLYSPEIKITAAGMVAINIGARLGIVGEPVLFKDIENPIEKLAHLQVEIFDVHTKIAEGKGSNLLKNPLNVVLWLTNDLNKKGTRLKKGDILSLGSITPLMPAKAGMRLKAVYSGISEKYIELKVDFK